MRHLAVLLSLYLFALNLAPCADDVATPDAAAKIEISHSADDHNHQDSDLCSPFCICQCCHISVTHFQLVELKFGFPYISTEDVLYLNGTEKVFPSSILQPPRA